MFRELYENADALYFILASFIILLALIYFIVGRITEKRGIYLKYLIIGKGYIFSVISSIMIFLTISFPLVLVVWFLLYFLANLVFKNDRKILSFINYYEQNKTALTSRQMRTFSKLNLYVTSTSFSSWIKSFYHLRRELLNKLNSDVDIAHLNLKCQIFPLPFFVSGIIGLFASLLTYGNLVENSNSFFMVLLENYAILSIVLLFLYVLLYFSLVGNVFHRMYGKKRLFKILFALFSIFMFVGVTAISMNNQ